MYRFLIAALLFVALPAQAEDESYAKLFEVHSRFAAKGSMEAQFKLGEMYEEGRGTAKDLNKAREWYEQAATQGHEEAKKRLTTLGSRLSTDDAKRLEREAQLAKKRAEEERQAALAQQRAEEERARQAAQQRREEERERQAQLRAEEERNRQQQSQQRRNEEERARLKALQSRQEEESAKRAAAAAEAQRPAAAPPTATAAPANSADDKSFETDPCKGAAARFLSTCK